MEEVSKKVQSMSLIKIEKKYNTSNKEVFFYYLKLEGIDELLLIESIESISPGIVGSTIQYKLNKEKNEITEFNIV